VVFAILWSTAFLNNMKKLRFCLPAVLLGAMAALGIACHHLNITAAAAPPTIRPGTSSTITATVTDKKSGATLSGKSVLFEVISGLTTCGNFGGLDHVTSTTDAAGNATASFSGSAAVETGSCTATIRVTCEKHSTTVTVTVSNP
jgi:hypothetical protein